MNETLSGPRIERLSFRTCRDDAILTSLGCLESRGTDLAAFLNLPFAGLLNVMLDRGDVAPLFMSSGPSSFTAQIFGSRFARECAGKDAVPDRAFGLSICEGFCEASWTLDPVLERITGKTNGCWVQFDRALFPAMLGGEIPTFVTLLKPQRVLSAVEPRPSG